jgi:hypothetical protein
MESVRVSLGNDDDYDTFVIHDVESMLGRMRADPRVAQKYKTMDVEKFKLWVSAGVTPKQFSKLQALSNYN